MGGKLLYRRGEGYSSLKRKITTEDFRLWNLTHDEWFDSLFRFVKYNKCPKCGFLALYGPSKRRLFECKKCGYQRSITSGTIMDKTRVSLDKWFLLFFMIYQERDNLSVVRVQDELGVSYPTAKLLLEKTKKNDDIGSWLDKTKSFIYEKARKIKEDSKKEEAKKQERIEKFEIFENKKDNNSLWLSELVFRWKY
jgi:transposase-like protein